MTLKQIEHKHHFDYHIIYKAMSHSGLLKHEKNAEYDEDQVLTAVDNYVHRRVENLMNKVGEIQWYHNKIQDYRKKQKMEACKGGEVNG